MLAMITAARKIVARMRVIILKLRVAAARHSPIFGNHSPPYAASRTSSDHASERPCDSIGTESLPVLPPPRSLLRANQHQGPFRRHTHRTIRPLEAVYAREIVLLDGQDCNAHRITEAANHRHNPFLFGARIWEGRRRACRVSSERHRQNEAVRRIFCEPPIYGKAGSKDEHVRPWPGGRFRRSCETKLNFKHMTDAGKENCPSPTFQIR